MNLSAFLSMFRDLDANLALVEVGLGDLDSCLYLCLRGASLDVDLRRAERGDLDLEARSLGRCLDCLLAGALGSMPDGSGSRGLYLKSMICFLALVLSIVSPFFMSCSRLARSALCLWTSSSTLRIWARWA